MPSTFTYPGVYITERPSGAQAVPSAATSIALFVGMTDIGPFDTPVRIQSLPSYVRTFGETSGGEMADQVKQFFINGGGDCYVMRIAEGEQQSEIRLQNETGTDVLRLFARDAGIAGNLLQVEVDYATATPELTFNLTAYRSVLNADGTFGRTNTEFHPNLTMNPSNARYVETVVNSISTLIRAERLAPLPAAADKGGASIGGVFLQGAEPDAQSDVRSVLDATHNSFRVSVAGRAPVTAVIDTVGLTSGNVYGRIETAIENANQAQGPLPAGSLTVATASGPVGLGRVLEVASTEGTVLLSSSATNDCAVALMLGGANGGLEFDDFSPLRPAPSGVFAKLGSTAGRPGSSWLDRLLALAVENRDELVTCSLADPGSSPIPYAGAVSIPGLPTSSIAHAPVPAPSPVSARGTMEVLRASLDAIGQGIVDAVNATPKAGRWDAQRQGLRLVLRPASTSGHLASLNVGLTTAPFDIGKAGAYLERTTSANAAAYTLGGDAGAGLQSGGLEGIDGTKPVLTSYQEAFATIDSTVEIFNLMVLPRAVGQTDADRRAVWGSASSFCAAQRAILFVDPPLWTTIVQADSGASAIKVGVDTRNAVAYWPRVLVPSATMPQGVAVDPSGSMAGVYARTDTRFGTWKAPAGLEATLTGVLGVEVPMSDAENGRINPKALNAIRVFPSGITAWGARTMVGADDTGNVDDKYVNVRRTMLLIENSLHRGLRFAVFRSNAEPLWASIRLAAGSFMNGLMLQGAFASSTKSEAYYVQCDSSTTTPNDINLGIVNVLVGFAPNKPAEFVHLILTQLAGQAEA